MEELKEQSRKMVESGGTGGIDIKFVIIETEPRCEEVTVQGWNTTTS